MTIRNGRRELLDNLGPGHADPLPLNGERHTRGGETDDDDSAVYWTDLDPEDRERDLMP